MALPVFDGTSYFSYDFPAMMLAAIGADKDRQNTVHNLTAGI